jgi:hypothetical protein
LGFKGWELDSYVWSIEFGVKNLDFGFRVRKLGFGFGGLELGGKDLVFSV